MKKVSRIFAIVLCLAIVLSVTAFANWTTFAGNNNHNAVVTSSPTSTTPSITEIALMGAGGGYDGVDTSPVMRTINGTTYAYVLYDGHAKGGHLAKINCSAATPYTVWDKQISGGSGFQLSTPLLVPGADEEDDVIYLASSVGDKYVLTNYNVTLPLSGVSSQTVSATIPEVKTASNRVAMGIYLGRATTSGAITTTGTATITVGSTSVTVNVSPSNTGTGVNYKTFEQEVYDTNGNVIGYDYYWYINHNINSGSSSVGSAATVSVAVSLSGGTGTIEYMDVYANQGAIQKISYLDSADEVDVENETIYGGVSGQINTPITTDGTYLYFGTYTGYNTAGTYYQITTTGSLQGSFNTSSDGNYGFYWSGAVSDGTNIYFGRDNGKVFWRSIANFSGSGGTLDLTDTTVGGVSGAGNVRSTIMIDGSNLYFTSQGGYLWCCSFDSTNSKLNINWYAALKHTTAGANVTSTSTPTKVGNRIYVGAYGGTGKSGVLVVDASTHAVSSVFQDNTMPVQSTIVVNGTGTGTDYIYFVTNYKTGTGYCYSWNGTTATAIWNGSAYHTTYDLGNMAVENGIAVFGNDYNYLYVIS
jgi:hypothetical protein